MSIEQEKEFTPSRVLAVAAGGLIVLLGLYLSSLYNYLLFHSIAEVFSIVVAFGIFMVGWNSRRFIENKYFLFLGIAYPFIGLLDLIHTLSYSGMNVFPGFDTNLPTELWIAARGMESVSLLLATLFVRRGLRLGPLVLGYAGASVLVLAMIFHWDLFPDCFIEGTGLTPFKKSSEYVISFILVASAALLYRERRSFDTTVLHLLLGSIFTTVASELSFTFFTDPYGHLNFWGHYLKIVSFFLIYRAIIYTGLRKPYRLLYADLQQSQEELRSAHSQLESRVKRRTAELEATNEILRREIAEREKTQEALYESEKLYTKLVEGSLTGVYMQQDGRFVFANERFAGIFGYSREEILGMETWKTVHPEDRSRFRSYQEKRMRGEEAPSEYEVRGLTREGRTIWINRRINLVRHKGRPAVLGNVADITKRKRMEQELRLLSSRILSAEEMERKRIAQELHDGLGQLLGAIKFRIESVLVSKQEEPLGEVRQKLEAVVVLIRQTIEEMRRILAALRPSMLDDLGIVPTINWLCREFQQTHAELVVEKDVSVDEQAVPGELKTVIYRVIQEGLNNVAKHSRARRVRVSLTGSDRTLLLEIEDNGTGFDEREKPDTTGTTWGVGIHSIRERTRFSGGSFEIKTGRGKGTLIRAAWPLP